MVCDSLKILIVLCIIVNVSFIDVCGQNFAQRLVCRRNGSNGFESEFLDCSLDARTKKLLLLPKPPECGIFNESSFVPTQTAHLKDYPWTVVLQYESNVGGEVFLSSGVLINRRYVLTSSFLISQFYQERNSVKLKSVRVGEYDLKTDPDCENNVCNEPMQNIEVEEVVKHNEQSYMYTTNDIGLIRLKEEVRLSDSVRPICLPISLQHYTEADEGRLVYVSGWGQIDHAGQGTTDFKKTNIVLLKIGSSSCTRGWYSYDERNYQGYHIDHHVCATNVRDANNCLGFGGGALMHKWRNIWVAEGITTHSGANWCGNRPGLYTSTSKFSNWILQNIRP